jgi:2,3-bisphosphoglycerate-dependent phosphoglycerate mutase
VASIRPAPDGSETPFDVVLVRHAQPDPPMVGMTEAEENDRPLTTDGRLASRMLGKALRTELVGAVFSSPYRRAFDTVRPIAEARGLSIRILEDLRERRLAVTPLGDVEFRKAVARAHEDPSFCLPGGESTADVIERGFGALERIRTETPSGVALVGTHGGLISILRWSLGDESSVERALSMPMPAMFRLRFHEGMWWLA